MKVVDIVATIAAYLIPMNTHQKLARWIERNFPTKAAFADLLGVSRAGVTRWCNGDRIPMRNAATAIELHTDGAISASDWGYGLRGSPGQRAIQAFMLDKGISLAAAADRVGVSRASLSMWAYGDAVPSPPYLKILSKALKTKLTEADFT